VPHPLLPDETLSGLFFFFGLNKSILLYADRPIDRNQKASRFFAGSLEKKKIKAI